MLKLSSVLPAEVYLMIKNIIGGIAVGIANVIPGVSGGTMMVLLGIFDKTMEAIPGVLAPKNPKRKEHIIFLFQVLVGVAVGLIGFAKVLEYLFNICPTQTMYWFIGLIAFSIPIFVNQEMKGHKFNVVAFIIGLAIVIGLELLSPKGGVDVNPAFPSISLPFLLTMILIGFVGGFSMFLPGVSGSMVLLILGYYYLFKSYLANVLTFSLDILIPLAFMGIGIILGIVVSAKVLNVALEKNKPATLSFLLGLIIASTMVLFINTLNVTFTFELIITSALSFLLGGVIIYLLNKVMV